MKAHKLFSMFIVFVMTLTLLPTTIWANEQDVSDETALQTAIANAPNGQETIVTLQSNLEISQVITIEENKQIKLDLNGKTITVASSFEGRPFKIEGSLIVTGNGKIDTSSAKNAYGSFDNYGNLYIENGTYIGYVYAGGAVVKNRPESYCEIYDGTFNGTPTAVYNEGITKIYGGTFDGRSCSGCDKNVWGYTIQSHWNDKSTTKPELYFYDGHVIGVQGAFSTSAGYSEIHNGIFETVSCDVHTNATTAWYALYVAGESGEVECHVYDGTFNAASKYAVYIGNSNDGGEKKAAAAYIHGGTFTSGRSDYVIYEDVDLGRVEITGGTFYLKDKSVADVSKWLSENYVQDESGTVAHNHVVNATHIEEKQPTCLENGNIEYWYCATCDKYFDDANCTIEIAKENTVLIATEHKLELVNAKAATCTMAGYTGDQVCTLCGEVVEKGATIAKLPHHYENGSCIECGHKIAVVAPVIDSSTPAEKIQIGVSEEDVSQVSKEISEIINKVQNDQDVSSFVSIETINAIKEALASGMDISAEIKIDLAIDPSVSDKSLIAEELKTVNGNVDQYANISIILKTDNKELGTVNLVDTPIQFIVVIPSDLIKDGRTFYVVRVHGAVADKLNTIFNSENNTLMFESDKFSTYALAYSDPTIDNENGGQINQGEGSGAPETGDNSHVLIWVSLLLISSTCLCGVALNKKYKYSD